MNPVSADARLARLEALLVQDPNNSLLLSDAADAAIAAAAFSKADEWVRRGLSANAGDAAWRFRQATLKIAQRQLDEARDLLQSLGSHSAVVHNLAYIEFLRGNDAQCAILLKPLLESSDSGTAPPEDPAAQALWLRAQHRLGALEEAWHWAQERLHSGRLGANAVGVASLIALDLSHVQAAAALARQALDAGVADVEPLVAGAGAALAARDTKSAKDLLQSALQRSPDDARIWSSLALAEMLDQQFARARTAFENALKTQPNVDYLQGLGWACVMAQDLDAAAAALDQAIALDASNAQSQGARAVVHAIQKETDLARACIARAFAMEPTCETARLAVSIIEGKSAAAQDLLSAAKLR